MPSRSSAAARRARLSAKPKVHRRANRAEVVGRVRACARVVLLAYVCLVAITIRFYPMEGGLDPSWAVGLNLFRNAGLIHGRDIGFTYGPLSFLIAPMDVGANLIEGVVFQTCVWITFCALLAWVVYARDIQLAPLAIFAACFYLGLRTFDEFGYAGPDIFAGIVALLLLGCSLDGRRWRMFYAAAAIVGAGLMLVKLSSGILALSACLTFPFALALVDRRKAAVAALIGFIGAPVSFAIAYAAYNPSFGDMLRYLRSGFEISSGHSSGMSQPATPQDLVAALAIGLAYIAVAILLLFLRQRAFVLAAACIGPLFLEFKHAFIRPPGHIDIFFCFAPLIIGLVFLFSDFREKARWPILAAFAIALLATRMHPPFTHPYYGFDRLSVIPELWNWTATRTRLAATSATALASDRLPPELLARIGQSPVAIFPWECAYAAANRLNYRPFPIFQSYDAYTSFLDEWNAAFFRDSARAPEFVLMDWASIDGRHPLLDVPAMFMELYRRYDVDGRYGPHILLRRRTRPRFTSWRPLRTVHVTAHQPVRIDRLDHPVIARIRLDYNIAGRLRRFFFNIPEVRATYASESGAFLSARIPPEVALDGLPVNFLPSDPDSLQMLFADNTVAAPFNALAIGGPGADLFEPASRVELYEAPEVTLRAAAPELVTLDGLGFRGSTAAARIEMINNEGVLMRGPREVIELSGKLGYITFTGSAVDALLERLPDAVYVKLDGRIYPARLGLARPDVAAIYNRPQYLNAGFEWTCPVWKLGSETHTVSVVLFRRGARTWVESEQKLKFRVTGSH
ncbi:MAG TPA: hypothetical protein VFA28_16370 [Bryobacteraceae bacterium]|nr:hypothetical protein [Bryobacteraceae bacterium]